MKAAESKLEKEKWKIDQERLKLDLKEQELDQLNASLRQQLEDYLVSLLQVRFGKSNRLCI